MGFRHLQAAYALALGNPGRKAVLTSLAYRACDECGICWPGVTWLTVASDMSERSVQRCLGELATSGHVTVRRYSHGGRGVSTEYLVLPQLPKLAAAPCPRCLERMKPLRANGRSAKG